MPNAVSDVAYQFLASNENTAINWYCSHCKPAALGVVAEVQKIAQKYADIDKRVKKLETQVKHKAITADLEDLRKTVLEDLDGKVTVDEMKDMQAMINESTKKVITESHSAMAKNTRPTSRVLSRSWKRTSHQRTESKKWSWRKPQPLYKPQHQHPPTPGRW